MKVDLDLDADGLSTPVIDLYDFNATGSIVMPDVVNQTMDDGNQFNIDQVNNLVDNDTNSRLPTTLAAAAEHWYDPGASFSMEAKIEGGKSKIDADNMGDRAQTLHSSADAAINQSAFDQNITQGANIQFNSITIQAAGDNLSDRRHKLVLRSTRAASAARVTFCESFHFRRCSCRQEAAGREA